MRFDYGQMKQEKNLRVRTIYAIFSILTHFNRFDFLINANFRGHDIFCALVHMKNFGRGSLRKFYLSVRTQVIATSHIAFIIRL